MTELAVTWWGHSSTTVEIGGARIATDPLLSRRLLHLKRSSPPPPRTASEADIVVVSHLHHDHLHLPSLLRFGPEVPIVVPKGAGSAVPGLNRLRILEMSPGESLDIDGITIEALAAHHDGRRHPLSRHHAPALGFRLASRNHSCWYAGDTGWHGAITEVAPVDLALVPIGGWGPSLGEDHLDPEQAARLVGLVGATYALAVHHGTFWPIAMRHVHPESHRRLFESPADRFVRAVDDLQTTALTPKFGERLLLDVASGTDRSA